MTVEGLNIAQVSDLSVTDALRWAEVLPNHLSDRERQIGRQVLKEIRSRLGFLVERRPRLSDDAPRGGTLSGRRGAAYPLGDADRLER